jgi:hypothetical protein
LQSTSSIYDSDDDYHLPLAGELIQQKRLGWSLKWGNRGVTAADLAHRDVEGAANDRQNVEAAKLRNQSLWIDGRDDCDQFG